MDMCNFFVDWKINRFGNVAAFWHLHKILIYEGYLRKSFCWVILESGLEASCFWLLQQWRNFLPSTTSFVPLLSENIMLGLGQRELAHIGKKWPVRLRSTSVNRSHIVLDLFRLVDIYPTAKKDATKSVTFEVSSVQSSRFIDQDHLIHCVTFLLVILNLYILANLKELWLN